MVLLVFLRGAPSRRFEGDSFTALLGEFSTQGPPKSMWDIAFISFGSLYSGELLRISFIGRPGRTNRAARGTLRLQYQLNESVGKQTHKKNSVTAIVVCVHQNEHLVANNWPCTRFSRATRYARFGLEGCLTPLETSRLGSVVEGFANFNPFAPQGHYNLDMTMPGDRDVLRALLLLDKVRPTEVNPFEVRGPSRFGCTAFSLIRISIRRNRRVNLYRRKYAIYPTASCPRLFSPNTWVWLARKGALVHTFHGVPDAFPYHKGIPCPSACDRTVEDDIQLSAPHLPSL